MVKRSRIDGQVSKEEYEESVASPTPRQATWRTATPAALAQRRMVKPRSHNDRRKEYMDAVRALNERFTNFVTDQVARDESVNLEENIQEYLAYVQQLQSRYLRQQGEVFTFGSSECHQCAHGARNAADIYVTVPRVLLDLRDKKVCNVACGGLHSVVVTSAGAVYTWGCNDDGALGRGGSEVKPYLVEGLLHETVIGVSAGDCHTLALTLGGEVYGWGSYKDKDNTSFFHAASDRLCNQKQEAPVLVQGLKDVVEIRSGAAHNLALTADSTVLSFGIGESGQLGRSVPMDLKEEAAEDGKKPDYDLYLIHTQHLTPLSEGGVMATGVKAIGCGGYHSLIVLALNSEVYATGLNQYGQLGLGDALTAKKGEVTFKTLLHHIKALDGLAITDVAGGSFHSLALSTPTGKLYAFGRSDSNQLGIGQDASSSSAGAFLDLPVPVPFPKDHRGQDPWISTISAGANFNLAVTARKDEVYTWGYGELGALGHGKVKGKEPVDEATPRSIDFGVVGVSQITVLKAEGGGQHSIILANVPSTYMDEAVKRKREDDEAYEIRYTYIYTSTVVRIRHHRQGHIYRQTARKKQKMEERARKRARGEEVPEDDDDDDDYIEGMDEVDENDL